jgi:transcriptional regulator with XRE-family HTH domain
MEEIGIKLRALRELHHYKQEYIGDYLGIGQSAYSRIENGKPDNISLGHINKLAELYKISPEQILGWDGKINIGTVNGVGVNQGTTNINNTAEERIKNLEEKIEQLMGVVGKG